METGNNIIAELKRMAQSLEDKYAHITADDIVKMSQAEFDAYFYGKYNDMVKAGYLKSFAKHRDGWEGKAIISSLRWYASDLMKTDRSDKCYLPMVELSMMFAELADRYGKAKVA